MDHVRQPRNPERRSFPRFDSTLLLKFIGDGFEITSSTRNISCSGMYCESTRYIPVMSRLAATLFVPLTVNGHREEYQICCSAVVVRVYPEEEHAGTSVYRLGCFFPDLNPTDREIISRYIEQAFLAKRN